MVSRSRRGADAVPHGSLQCGVMAQVRRVSLKALRWIKRLRCASPLEPPNFPRAVPHFWRPKVLALTLSRSCRSPTNQVPSATGQWAWPSRHGVACLCRSSETQGAHRDRERRRVSSMPRSTSINASTLFSLFWSVPGTRLPAPRKAGLFFFFLTNVKTASAQRDIAQATGRPLDL